MKYQLITTSEQLRNVCAMAARHAAIALDTEFVRTRTLTPRLGLLQLYDGEQLVLIDPIQISDMQPFIALMENPDVVKVLHSCSEDLETFLNAFSTVPTPVFDTQFAAALLNIGPSLGYARLVEILSGVVLDKGESRTDWLARPLSEKQLHYAANDVLYLLPVYETINKQITELGKLGWVFDEMNTLVAKKAASMPPEYAYLLIKNNWRLNTEQLTVLQHLAAWRLGMAREKDLAINFVLKESIMYEIAMRLPDNRNSLSHVTGMIGPTMRRFGEVILEIVNKAREEFRDLPAEKRVPSPSRLVDFPGYKKNLALLKQAADDIARNQNVPVEVIASKKQLNQVLKWYWFDIDETRVQGLLPDLLTGWRAPLFASYLDKILGPVEKS